MFLLSLFVLPGLYSQDRGDGTGEADTAAGQSGASGLTAGLPAGLQELLADINSLPGAWDRKYYLEFRHSDELMLSGGLISRTGIAGPLDAAELEQRADDGAGYTPARTSDPGSTELYMQRISFTLPVWPDFLPGTPVDDYRAYDLYLDLLYGESTSGGTGTTAGGSGGGEGAGGAENGTGTGTSEDAAPAFGLLSARLEVYGPLSAPAQTVSAPAAPLLEWPAGAARASGTDIGGRKIIIRFRYGADDAIETVSRYYYGSDGELYELRRLEGGVEKSFTVLPQGRRGMVELFRRESVETYRRFDDRGRLVSSSAAEGSVSVNYLDGGGRRETERYADGSVEEREYDGENHIISRDRQNADGSSEERSFEYTANGDIAREEYRSLLGVYLSEYNYNGGQLSSVETYRDGQIILKDEISGNDRVETRYLRGEAVLRIYYRDDVRLYEEELYKGEVLRRRDYGEAGSAQ